MPVRSSRAFFFLGIPSPSAIPAAPVAQRAASGKATVAPSEEAQFSAQTPIDRIGDEPRATKASLTPRLNLVTGSVP
jgi:hypothetical protein